MARAFVVLALGGTDPPGPAAPGRAPCRLLYARSFGDPQGDPSDSGDTARQRLRRKEQLLALARQVASQCRLLQASSGRLPSPQLPQRLEEPISLQDAPGGLFQLRPGDPFPERVTVAWISVLSLAFALVCDPRENLSLAEITLRRLTPRFLASLRLLGSGTDILLRPEVADRLLDRLLPHGRLLFLNECFLQALDREMGLKAAR